MIEQVIIIMLALGLLATHGWCIYQGFLRGRIEGIKEANENLWMQLTPHDAVHARKLLKAIEEFEIVEYSDWDLIHEWAAGMEVRAEQVGKRNAAKTNMQNTQT